MRLSLQRERVRAAPVLVLLVVSGLILPKSALSQCEPVWTRRTPTTAPAPRVQHAMAYDRARGMTVLHGGTVGPGALGDTWEWDGQSWTQKSTSTALAPRCAAAMAYDSARGVTILFWGASVSSQYYNDCNETWKWDGVTWAAAQARLDQISGIEASSRPAVSP